MFFITFTYTQGGVSQLSVQPLLKLHDWSWRHSLAPRAESSRAFILIILSKKVHGPVSEQPISFKVRMCLSASMEQGSVQQLHWNTQPILLFREVITAWKRYFCGIEGNKCPRALITFPLGPFSPFCNSLLVFWLIPSALSMPYKTS